MTDLANIKAPISLVGVSQQQEANRKFFLITGGMMAVGVILATIMPTGLHTSLSQNLIKTTAVSYICFSILYSFMCLYRFLAKKKLVRTLKEIVLTLLFLLWLYDFSVLIDWALIATDRDLDAVPSNIIAYSLIALFVVFQTIILRKDKN
ncbi:hypothetical protein HLH17_14425 [Acinetobacter sp. ANC 5380]|uniref:Uncharacterized protein n=1 Tax=Acinetobacter terrae TaxID=2731247 RepID=A0A7Y2WBX6_9GAMM|nr:hypothetical protein [Acinetobacter terrae]NNH78817.1 hypothetical protein [Acinetobacter terrae]